MLPCFCAFLASSFPPAAAEVTRPEEQLAQLVGSFVVRDEIVGAELLVVRDGVPVLHRAFGFSDREAKRAMAPGQFFAVRSMTKPFTGMAAQILVDEGRLELDAPVAKYLPSFANEKSRAVTVRQLLTHRGGFPFFDDPGKPLSAFSGLRELADRAGERGPTQAPGARFVYSDVGSDVLGAVVAAIAGEPLEAFVRARILEPLKLGDTFPEPEAVTALRRERVPVRYLGAPGRWTPYWSAGSAPIYPWLKGSGGLFATAEDYARFLQAWMDGASGAGAGVLSAAAFQRALAPASREALSTGFFDAVADYGQMWTLYRPRNAPAEIFAFGHGGSDGTAAYAFPKEKLVVVYLTQTRGNETHHRFEAALSHLFLRPDPAAFARLIQPAAARGLEEFTGLYSRDNTVASLAAIVAADGTLAFEFPGRTLIRLRATEDRDRWVPDRAPNDAITFRREDGRVVGLTLTRGSRVEEAQRFRPDGTLPGVEELRELRAQAVPTGPVAALLPLRITRRVERQGAKFELVEIMERDGRLFSELDLGTQGKIRTWIDGGRVWRELPGGAPIELFGVERGEQIDGSLAGELSDWRTGFRELVVLARESRDGREAYRVRLVTTDGFATAKLVDARQGTVLGEYALAMIPGAGLQATEKRHADFRDLDGVTIAHGRTMAFATAPAAQVNAVVVKLEPRVTVDAAAFRAPGR